MRHEEDVFKVMMRGREGSPECRGYQSSSGEREGVERMGLLTNTSLAMGAYLRILLWKIKPTSLASLNTENQKFLKSKGSF